MPPASSCGPRSRTRGSASTRSRRTTFRRSSPPSLGARPAGRERRLARRVGACPPRPACRTRRSRSRGSARPTRTCGRRSGRPRDGDPLRWLAVEVGGRGGGPGRARSAGRPRARRPAAQDVLFRLNPDVAPGDPRRLGGRRRRIEVRHDRGRAGRRGRPGRGPPGRASGRGASTSTSGRSWARSTPGATPSARALATLALLRGDEPDFDTLDVGGGFPVGPFGEPSPRPARFARELPAAPRGDPGRPPAAAPRDRAGPVPRRPGRLARRPRPPCPRSRRPPGRARRRDDRADPAGALRRAARDRRADVARQRRSTHAACAGPGRTSRRDVHGPICESTDALGEHLLPPLRRGDLVAIRDAGAYGASLSSTYNGRPRPPQVLLDRRRRLTLVRRRGTVDEPRVGFGRERAGAVSRSGSRRAPLLARRRDGHAALRQRRPAAGLPRRARDDPAGPRRLDPPGLPRGRRRHHRDGHVRREPVRLAAFGLAGETHALQPRGRPRSPARPATSPAARPSSPARSARSAHRRATCSTSTRRRSGRRSGSRSTGCSRAASTCS